MKGPLTPVFESVAGCGSVDVAGQCGLVEAVVAEAGFVDPARAGSPDPVSSDDLGAGVNLGAPVGLQLGKVFHRAVVVSEEIHAADAIALVEVVIDLGQQVVDAHVVWKSLNNVDALRVVNREASAIAGYGGARDAAARNLLAGGADGDAVGEQVGNCIRECCCRNRPSPAERCSSRLAVTATPSTGVVTL